MWWVMTAWAGVTGTVGGKPFEAKSVLGMAGNQPGTLGIVLVDQELACGAKPTGKPNVLSVAFDATPGTTALQSVLTTPKTPITMVEVDATLVSMPAAVGGTGKVEIRGVKGAKKTSLSGDAEFVLCQEILVATPPVATWSEHLVDGADLELRFAAPVPDWPTSQDYADRTVWTTADHVTTFWLDSTCDGGCSPESWPEKAKKHATEQLSGFASDPNWETRIWKDSSPREGVQVTEFGYGAAGTPKKVTLEVLFYGPDWPQMAVCHAETSERYLAFLDEVEAKCLELRRLP